MLPWLAAPVFALAALAVWRLVREHDAADLRRALADLAAVDLLEAGLFAAGSYLVLSLFDWLGARSAAGADLPYRRVAFVSFTAMSLGHTLGFASFSSSVIRYRMYSRYGLGGLDVARIVIFSGVTVAAGHAALAGAAGLWRPDVVAELAGIPRPAALALGATSVALLVLYLAWSAFAPARARARGWRTVTPPMRVACLQIMLGALNYLLVAGALHRLLGDAAEVPLLAFASLYVAGNALAIVSHVPGGLGVLELVVLAAVPGAEVVGALIAFRLVYFVAPFVLGLCAYAGFELLRRRRPAPPSGSGPVDQRGHDRHVVRSDR